MHAPSRDETLRLILQLMLWVVIGTAGYAIGSTAKSFNAPMAMAVAWGVGGVFIFLDGCFGGSEPGT